MNIYQSMLLCYNLLACVYDEKNANLRKIPTVYLTISLVT